MLRSSKHEVRTIEVNKVALNRDDDKWISKKDGISSLARGHKDLSWSPLLGELSLISNSKFLHYIKNASQQFQTESHTHVIYGMGQEVLF